MIITPLTTLLTSPVGHGLSGLIPNFADFTKDINCPYTRYPNPANTSSISPSFSSANEK